MAIRMQPVDGVPGLWRIAAETNGYLIVRGARSLLIDCPAAEVAEAVRDAGLPIPDTIVHTQVQEEHCREWAAFPEARVFVHPASEALARLSQQYFDDCATEWPPSREWGETLGAEEYGVGGCVTARPPARPLAVAGAVRHRESFCWEDVSLRVIPLPACGKRAIGLHWQETGVLFSGDLLYAGGYLVNMYDLERCYGAPTGYVELRESLHRAAGCAPSLMLPSTGPIIARPREDCGALLERIAWIWRPPTRRQGESSAIINYVPIREFGRYREVLPGLYQNNNSGNVILFVDAEGRGAMVDPDPCVWLSWEENCAEMHADLDLLEQEAGLKRVEIALITHYHGDHLEYSDLLRERYGTEILATPDVAEVMERPQDFRYPCAIDWYGFPFKAVRVDRRIPYNTPFLWHDVPITPIHTPGHCCAHAGFALPWDGLRTVCAGDTLQYGAGPIGVGLPVLYNDTAWPDRGAIVTYRRLLALRPDLVLGGHSHSFFDRDGSILRDMHDMAEESLRLAQAMVHDGDLLRAMTPPGYDALRPACALTERDQQRALAR